jgi:hypothetical protein
MDEMPLFSDHFLTLPSGRTITIPDGKDTWEVYEPYVLVVLGRGDCPWCLSPLTVDLSCYDRRHPACRWHYGPACYGQVILDNTSTAARCSECGCVM